MVREFFRWWSAQLAGLLPQALQGGAASVGDALILTPVGGLGPGIEAIAASRRRGGRETPIGRFALDGKTPEAFPRASGKPVVLRLPAGEALAKTVILPLAAERDLDQVLGFEMDRETPFAVEEVYWSHHVESREGGRLAVRLLLVPRAVLTPLIAALGERGLKPRGAEIADGPDGGRYLPLDDDGGRLNRSSARVVRWVAALCALFAFAAAATPFLRQSAALAAADRAVAAGRAAAAEAEKLRRRIDRLSGGVDLAAQQRSKAGRPLEILAAATGVLPDDTYLTELILRRGKLTLSGRSAAAAPLIGALAASGEFRNPAFSAPVTHLPTLHVDAFTIVAEVAP